MAFLREDDSQHSRTPEGNVGRIAQIKGTSKEMTKAFEMLVNYIIKYENKAQDEL